MIAHCEQLYFQGAIYEGIAMYCDLNVLEKYMQGEILNSDYWEFIVWGAIRANNVNILDFVKSMNGFYGEQFVCACEIAAELGNLQALIWLRQNNCVWGSTIFTATQNGHLNIIRHAVENGCVIVPHIMFESAVQNGHVNILKWLKSYLSKTEWQKVIKFQRVRINEEPLGKIVEVFQWMLNEEKITLKDTYTYAETYGDINLLNFFYQTQPDYFPNVASAITRKQIHVLRWILAKFPHFKFTTNDVEMTKKAITLSGVERKFYSNWILKHVLCNIND